MTAAAVPAVLPSVPEWLCTFGHDLRELAEAYKAALDAGKRLDHQSKPWVEVHCRCGSFVTVPARPMHPACSARRVARFVDTHNGVRCQG